MNIKKQNKQEDVFLNRMHSNLCSNDKKRQKLVYINDDLFYITFKRMHTRDYRCTRELSNVFVEKGVTKDKRYKNEFVFINMDFFHFT